MLKQKYRIYLLFITLVTLQACGKADSSSPNDLKEKPDTELHDDSQSTEIYYCSMHPKVRQTEPGDCPICGMDLILDKKSTSDIAKQFRKIKLQMGRYVSESMNLQTAEVKSGLVNIEIQLPGKIELDPTKSVRMSTYIVGGLTGVVNFEGAYVEKDK